MLEAPADGLTRTTSEESIVAKRQYIVDSPFLLPPCPISYVGSEVTGGVIAAPEVGHISSGIFLSIFAPSIA